MQFYREIQIEPESHAQNQKGSIWGTRLLEELQQKAVEALRERNPERRIRVLIDGTLAALHGDYMSVILKNDRGTYDLFLECTRFPDVSGRDVVQDVPESNLGPRLWDALYRGRGIFIDDVQHSQGDRKNDWDPVMFSKIDNVVIIPLQKSDKFAGMVVLCNISEESRDGYIRFVPMLKVILENDIQNFGARQSSIHVEAEPEREKEEKSYLWDTLFQDGNIGIFYKDSQRRYVDANENFLSWYHLEPGELQGKTDEELGMHEFSETMKEEEEQILATGVKILNQIRRIVWDGEERFVLISKLPVWKNGVLKGIVGYVMDLTSGDVLDTSVYTLLTGPQRQNRQQVVELGRSWETGYRENGRDFAYLSVQVMQREEFASRFGEEACRQMKKAILYSLRHILPGKAEIVQLYGARFAILLPCKSMEEALHWEDRVHEVLQTLFWTKGGKSFPVRVMVGSARYSETHNMEDVIALAESRMRSDIMLPGEEAHDEVWSLSRQEMEQRMRLYASVFDYVRLVNPENQTAWLLDKDGKLFTSPDKCFQMLGRTAACSNCTSRMAIMDRKTHRRVTVVGNKNFYIESRYVEMDGKPYAIELIDSIGNMRDFVPEYGERMKELKGEWDFLEKQNRLLRQKNRELYQLSRTDTLTHMENRRGLRYAFMKYIRHHLMVMMVDIDDFKQYNDRNGHEAGDHVLVQFAHILMDVFGDKNCFRYGGDEFLVIANLSEEEFDGLMKQVLDRVSRISIPGAVAAPRGSFGCVYGYADSQETLRNMIRQADYYMYQVKNVNKVKYGARGADVKKEYYDEHWMEKLD